MSKTWDLWKSPKSEKLKWDIGWYRINMQNPSSIQHSATVGFLNDQPPETSALKSPWGLMTSCCGFSNGLNEKLWWVLIQRLGTSKVWCSHVMLSQICRKLGNLCFLRWLAERLWLQISGNFWLFTQWREPVCSTLVEVDEGPILDDFFRPSLMLAYPCVPKEMGHLGEISLMCWCNISRLFWWASFM